MTEKQYNLGKTIKKVKIMTEKRFRLTNPENKLRDMNCGINDIDKILTFTEVVKLLNELYEENQEYKALFQDIGMILSHKKIVDKITQPLHKSCGFDIDVDTDDGFTIITNKKELNKWINENELK